MWRFPREAAKVIRNIGGHIADTSMAVLGSTVAQTVNPVEIKQVCWILPDSKTL